MVIQILGTGCPKCRKLEENVREAVRDLGDGHQVEKVTNIRDIMSFGVMMTPALAIDGEVKMVGKVPSVDSLKEMLKSA